MPVPDTSILSHFSVIEDPRSPIGRLHPLDTLLILALCGVICGADSWVEVSEWAVVKQEWLETVVEMPHGVPSHDTFSRVFSVLNPKQLQACFVSWTTALAEQTDGEVIAIDGKTVRRSFHRASDKAAIQMVSAWATQNRLVLAQVKTDADSNEITAVPALLRLLSLKGAIVTLDAMGCQKAIAQQIIEQEGDYVLRVKANHPILHEQIQEHFDAAHASAFAGQPHDEAETIEKSHGRSEERRLWSTPVPDPLAQQAAWRGLQSVALVERIRTVGEKTSVEYAYYLSSLRYDNAQQLLSGVRAHWGIENQVHWCLDMTFREDDSRIWKGHGAENMAVIRHMALNLGRQETTPKKSLRVKRKHAAWDHGFLLRILGVPWPSSMR
jgi:predicted transposase YbfD/YdcC